MVLSGGRELALELEKKGYAGWMPELAPDKPAARASP